MTSDLGIGFLYLQKPRYYDAPDGQKPIDKIVATSKLGYTIGMFIGMTDTVFYTQSKNAREVVNCLAYWTVPIIGMAASFSAVTYASTNIRGKDDAWNYALGAASCGPILSAWWKSTRITFWGTSALIVAALAAKHKQVHGWEIMVEPKHQYGNYTVNWSMAKKYDRDFRSPYF